MRAMLAILMLGLTLAGCSMPNAKVASDASAAAADRYEESVSGNLELLDSTQSINIQREGEIGRETSENSTAAVSSQNEDQATKRKIIYTAHVQLVVENFDGIEVRVRRLVEQNDGYVAVSNLDRMQGERRAGRWTVRIPVSNYEKFLGEVSQLGIPSSQNQTAQDVTEEFVDLRARITNKRKLEERVLELLERPDDKIQHVIEVEKELARIRGEIERMEGRLRFLVNQTDMTTVNIRIREERDYQPPQAPTFDNRITSAWSNSLHQTATTFQDTIVFLVRNGIGIIVWLIGLTLAWLVARFVWRRFRGAPSELSSAADSS